MERSDTATEPCWSEVCYSMPRDGWIAKQHTEDWSHRRDSKEVFATKQDADRALKNSRIKWNRWS